MLGLNSGTSVDGLDMVAVRISRSGRRTRIKYLAGCTRPYPGEIRQLVKEVVDSRTVELDTIIELDSLLGQFFGRAAATYCRSLSRRGIRVDALASHGQTVRHRPRKRNRGGFMVHGTLQLGSPEQVAAAGGKPVVADFRQADVAAGNEGAPITTTAVERLFATPDETRLLVNIGGMANYFYLPGKVTGRRLDAADCGPGNCLSDNLTQQLFGERFDRRGARAARGQISQRLLTLLLANPFFSSGAVSTGREDFGQVVVDEILGFGGKFDLQPEDMLATAVELTAATIAMKVAPLVSRDSSLSKLYLTGGGRKNSFLVDRLRQRLPAVEIRPVDELGWDGDLVEAASFAVLGEACLRSEPLNRHRQNDRTGIGPILGRIVQPPVKARK